MPYSKAFLRHWNWWKMPRRIGYALIKYLQSAENCFYFLYRPTTIFQFVVNIFSLDIFIFTFTFTVYKYYISNANFQVLKSQMHNFCILNRIFAIKKLVFFCTWMHAVYIRAKNDGSLFPPRKCRHRDVELWQSIKVVWSVFTSSLSSWTEVKRALTTHIPLLQGRHHEFGRGRGFNALEGGGGGQSRINT